MSRSLYFYVKKAHIGAIDGIEEYVEAFVSEKAVGDFGYLSDRGLIPAPKSERAQVRDAALGLTPVSLPASQ